METPVFHIADYVAPGESYHYARKALPSDGPRHGHDSHELLLIERGAAQHWINGETEQLAAGDLVCLRPPDVHALRPSRAEGCWIVNVMFRSEIAAHLAARYPDETRDRFFWHDGARPHRTHLSGPRFERAINVLAELQTTSRSLARIEGMLLTLLNRIHAASDRLQGVAPPWLVSALAAAQTEPVFREGAAGLVGAAGRSHEHVCRAMRRHLGTTPTAFVNRIRTERAAQLLTATDLPIPEIAERLGLENLGHFYRLFGTAYGTTPRAYRLRHQRDPFSAP